MLTGAYADWHARGALNAASLPGVLDGPIDVVFERLVADVEAPHDGTVLWRR